MSQRTTDRLLVVLFVLLGVWIRVDWMNRSALWCDEAESSINALTILQTGLPGWKYQGLPIYENTLTDPWPEHPEYEFRDSSYSPVGVTVYHGWLPLYSIAAAQWLAGMRPDPVPEPLRLLHDAGDISFRTLVPRLPSIVFSILYMVLAYSIGRQLGGRAAGFATLTLAAFNAATVDFGFQARYYSLTLLASAFAAWSLLRALRRGGWGDFLLLGLAGAVLFHTHQFSALVFAGVAVVSLPVMVRVPQWFRKALVGGLFSSALVLPWIWYSGFLVTASSVPKAFKLFGSPADWVTYSLARPAQLAVLAILGGTVLLTLWRPKLLPAQIGPAIRSHSGAYLALIAWLVLAYGLFHLIVPAASFFYERLTLVLWTPYMLALALFVSDVLRGLKIRRPALIAVILMVLFLQVRDRFAWTGDTTINSSREVLAQIIDALGELEFADGTKLYAPPNEHLTLTYYTGLPIQSVAPVRRSFFETYPHPVIFIERQMGFWFASEDSVLRSAKKAGVDVTDTLPLHESIWRTFANRDLALRGIPPLPEPTAPDFLAPTLVETELYSKRWIDEYLREMRRWIIFRAVEARTPRDAWLSFFYRFSDPASRVDLGLNILPRLRDAEAISLPFADVIIFVSKKPVSPSGEVPREMSVVEPR